MSKTFSLNKDDEIEETSSISERQEKKRKNPLLDPIEKRLLDERNKAPASTFIKRQDRLKRLLEEM